MAILTVLLCVVLISHGVRAQEEKTSSNTGTAGVGQCSNELEGLRFHMYSELADSKKELDSLRTDLQYWQNTTLSILKKYLVEKEDDGTCNVDAITDSINKLTTQSGECNNTEDIVYQVREVMEQHRRVLSQELQQHRRVQSQELREIISEMSSGRLPLGTFLNPAPSCKQLNGSSGNYWIQNAGTGYASLAYCDMTRRCCNSTGGWMRVAFLDMTNPNHRCPSGFRSITSPKRTCGRPGSGCYSTTYSVDGIAYSRVCGRIKAYQYYSPDAFLSYYINRALTIDDGYVDGVSLTHGQNPRKHIWTFANAVDETRSQQSVCPCTKTDTPFTGVVPPFIGQDYFCDTGSRYAVQIQFYTSDPLWDSEGCGSTSSCCQFNNPPWFCKELPQATTEDIELRLCADGSYANDEDVAIEAVELYVQ